MEIQKDRRTAFNLLKPVHDPVRTSERIIGKHIGIDLAQEIEDAYLLAVLLENTEIVARP